MTNWEFDVPIDDMENIPTLTLDVEGDPEEQTVLIDACEMQVYVGASSVIGKRREQQDSVKTDFDYVFSEEGRGIAVLCDGMGGLHGGAEASRLCADLVHKAYHELPEGASVSGFYSRVISRADEQVFSLKNADGTLMRAGTTMVSVVIEDGMLHWASVGDSRIYIRRKQEILCLTKDHNLFMLLEQKVKRGEITREEAERDPKKEALISFIGINGVQYVSRNSRPLALEDGDHIILCSDGLYRTVSQEEMLQVVSCFAGEAEAAAEALTQLAMSKNKPHQDNTSVIVLEYRKTR